MSHSIRYLGLGALLSLLAANPAAAFSPGKVSLATDAQNGTASVAEEVHIVCDQYGRCFDSRPRYRYIQRPRYYVEDDYGYGGYGYGYAPGIGFGFGGGHGFGGHGFGGHGFGGGHGGGGHGFGGGHGGGGGHHG